MRLKDADILIDYLSNAAKNAEYTFTTLDEKDEISKNYYSGRKAAYVNSMLIVDALPTIDYSPIFKDLLFFIEDKNGRASSSEIIRYIKEKYDVDLAEFVK